MLYIKILEKKLIYYYINRINLIHDNNSGMRFEYKINKNNLKNEYSNDKINIKSENKSNQTNNNNKKNVRNFDIQTNYNRKKITTIVPAPQSIKGNNNKIWSNINKDLVPTKEDLKFQNVENNSKNKNIHL